MKRSLALLLLPAIIIFSCNTEEKPDEKKITMPKKEIIDPPTAEQTVVGVWKWVEWNQPDLQFTPEEKAKVMQAAEIEITADGKFITRSAGKPDAIADYVYDKGSNMLTTTIDGKADRNQVIFNGNRMELRGETSSITLEKK